MNSRPHKQLQGLVSPSRNYICPCGKQYLSYAALFTHIKHKHDGQAPGQIITPVFTNNYKGRPAKKVLELKREHQKKNESRKTMISLPSPLEENIAYRTQFQKIFQYLDTIRATENIPQRIWGQVNSFRIFEGYVDGKVKNEVIIATQNFISLGFGLGQFLRDVSVNTQSFKFNQILVLFMLILQYIVDENDSPQVINQQPIDYIIEFMNPFINSYVKDYSEYLGIETIWAVQIPNINFIFDCFYNWMKWRNYTQLCITLID